MSPSILTRQGRATLRIYPKRPRPAVGGGDFALIRFKLASKLHLEGVATTKSICGRAGGSPRDVKVALVCGRCCPATIVDTVTVAGAVEMMTRSIMMGQAPKSARRDSRADELQDIGEASPIVDR